MHQARPAPTCPRSPTSVSPLTVPPSAGRLTRGRGGARAAAPVRLVHLGLGSFFRAHQAWYTDRAPDADAWGHTAFGGREGILADALTSQDCLYTLVTRAADGDRFDVVSSLTSAHPADDHQAWLESVADRRVAAITVTVTEAGYLRGVDGGLNRARDDVLSEITALRRDPTAAVRTVPARLLAGLAARRRADSGPIALVPCDNLPANAAVLARVVHDLAESVDAALADWITTSVSTVATVVDRITPRTSADDTRAVSAATGIVDDAPVVTEAFSEWVLSGSFPAGRPAWHDAGATFTEDVTPFEHRKLWLLNGGHSLLAYAGLLRGHTTVAESVADDTCRGWLHAWWAEAAASLDLPGAEVARYRSALLERFANPRMRHQLAQIAADGSQKLPVRVLPTLRAERAAGRVPAGASGILASWVCHLRGPAAAVSDVRAAELVALAAGRLVDAVPRVLAVLDPALADDRDLVAAVRSLVEQSRRPAQS